MVFGRDDEEGGGQMGELRILGPQGDTTVTWDPEVAEEVDEVRRRFEEVVSEGYLVFELDAESREGTQVKTLDPQVRELRAFRPMVGG
jgi:hypothetical protein